MLLDFGNVPPHEFCIVTQPDSGIGFDFGVVPQFGVVFDFGIVPQPESGIVFVCGGFDFGIVPQPNFGTVFVCNFSGGSTL